MKDEMDGLDVKAREVEGYNKCSSALNAKELEVEVKGEMDGQDAKAREVEVKGKMDGLDEGKGG